jgi:hypothetical protein
MHVRARRSPRVVLRESACPECGLALAVDVTVADAPPVVAPQLAQSGTELTVTSPAGAA